MLTAHLQALNLKWPSVILGKVLMIINIIYNVYNFMFLEAEHKVLIS